MGLTSLRQVSFAASVLLLASLSHAQTGAFPPPAPSAPPRAPAAAPSTPPPAVPAPPAPAPAAAAPNGAAPAPTPAAPAPAAAPTAPAPATAPIAPAAAAPQPVPAAPQPQAPAPVPPATVPPPNSIDLSTPPPSDARVVSSRVATNGSPFFDVTLGGLFLEERFSDPIVVGIQGGAYLGDIVRLSLRAEMPSSEATDQASVHYDYQSSYSLVKVNSEPARFVFGGTLGVTVVNSQNFAFSPGVMALRSDVSDYGTVVGVSLPFEWITSRGMRFGLEVDLGRAFGGTAHVTCASTTGFCPTNDLGDRDRNAGRALGLRFSIGYGIGFNRAR